MHTEQVRDSGDQIWTSLLNSLLIIIIKRIHIQDKNFISYVKKSQTVINRGPVY
jgi:hypothetical protein